VFPRCGLLPGNCHRWQKSSKGASLRRAPEVNLDYESSGRQSRRRNSSRMNDARQNSFVRDYAEGAEKVPVGLGFRSAAAVWIFSAMIAAFAVVSCSQHKTSTRVPVANTSSAQSGRQSEESSTNGDRAETVPAGKTPTGAHLGLVTPGIDVGGNRIGPVETGLASWYGVPYHGRRASNGEVYDM